MSLSDPTIAARSRRPRTIRAARTRNTRTMLTATQERALDLLLDAIAENGEEAGPWPESREPAVKVEAWRAQLRRNMFQGNSNPRQAVRRLMRTMIALGVVIERDGWVCVGVYGVDIAVT